MENPHARQLHHPARMVQQSRLLHLESQRARDLSIGHSFSLLRRPSEPTRVTGQVAHKVRCSSSVLDLLHISGDVSPLGACDIPGRGLITGLSPTPIPSPASSASPCYPPRSASGAHEPIQDYSAQLITNSEFP